MTSPDDDKRESALGFVVRSTAFAGVIFILAGVMTLLRRGQIDGRQWFEAAIEVFCVASGVLYLTFTFLAPKHPTAISLASTILASVHLCFVIALAVWWASWAIYAYRGGESSMGALLYIVFGLPIILVFAAFSLLVDRLARCHRRLRGSARTEKH